jgi:hypothetical protein
MVLLQLARFTDHIARKAKVLLRSLLMLENLHPTSP